MLPCNSSLPTFRKCCENRQSYERDSQSHFVSRTCPFMLIFTGQMHLMCHSKKVAFVFCFNCIELLTVLITVYDCMYRYVVELMGMVVEFIQNLEVKIKMVQAIPKTDNYLSNLVSVCIYSIYVF